MNDGLNREQLAELLTVLPMLEEIVLILDNAKDCGDGNISIVVPGYLTAYFDKKFPGCRVERKSDERAKETQ
jgi:hypothetical protein